MRVVVFLVVVVFSVLVSSKPADYPNQDDGYEDDTGVNVQDDQFDDGTEVNAPEEQDDGFDDDTGGVNASAEQNGEFDDNTEATSQEEQDDENDNEDNRDSRGIFKKKKKVDKHTKVVHFIDTRTLNFCYFYFFRPRSLLSPRRSKRSAHGTAANTTSIVPKRASVKSDLRRLPTWKWI